MNQQVARLRLAQDIRETPIRYFHTRRRPSQRAFFYDDHMVCFLVSGNQAGKTEVTTARAAMAMTGIEPRDLPGSLALLPRPPVHIRHWCPDLIRTAEEVILPKYLRYIPPSMLDTSRGGKNGYNREKATLYLTNGSWVQFMSYGMDPGAGKGYTLHIVILDEAGPEHVFNEQYARVARHAGRIWGAMTLAEFQCNWPIHWVDKRIIRRGDGPHVTHLSLSTRENFEALAAETDEAEGKEAGEAVRASFANWQRSVPEHIRRVVIDGQPGWLGGVVYKNFRDELNASYWPVAKCGGQLLHGADVIRWLARSGYGSVYAGMDQGCDHPTACIWVFVPTRDVPELQLKAGDYIQFAEYKESGAVPEHIARLTAMNQYMGTWPRACFADPHFWEDDPKGGISIGDMYCQARFPMVKGHVRDKDAGVASVTRLLDVGASGWAPIRLVKGMCPKTEDEFHGWQYNRKWTTGEDRDKYIRKDDDLMQCWRYLVVAQPDRLHELGSMRPPEPSRDRMTGLSADLLGIRPRRPTVYPGAYR